MPAELVILIPALSRPDNAQPVIDSLAAATSTSFRAVFLCSPADLAQIKAAHRTGADVMVMDWPPGRGDFAKKINAGYTATSEPWVFQAADDVVFHPGWDTAALAAASGRRPYGVVGTNDLHNPAVLRGRHSTHTLFSRRYIDRFGSGTVDGTGIVFCELYDHQLVDNEFVETAVRRGQFVFARDSIVEHHHPHWGLASMDRTYDKALRETVEDRTLFQERRRLIRDQFRRHVR